MRINTNWLYSSFLKHQGVKKVFFTIEFSCSAIFSFIIIKLDFHRVVRCFLKFFPHSTVPFSPFQIFTQENLNEEKEAVSYLAPE